MKNLLFAVLLSFVICGCDKEETIDIALEYIMCPCEHETEIYEYPFWAENMLLFDAAKTSLVDMKKISFDSKDGGSRFIKFDYEHNQATYISIHGTMESYGYICNFPGTFNWHIPSKGLRVSCYGDVFDTCEPKYGIAIYSYSNIVLTSLKLHIK